MFIDTARISVKAGRGGDGCTSFYRDKFTRPYADGGHGGPGGDVILQVNPNIATLFDFQHRRHFAAGRGVHGGPNGRTGAHGDVCLIAVPPGTIVRDASTGDLVCDLTEREQRFVAARGGAGGIGNESHRDAEPGQLGEERELTLELRLIADVGIIGAPNAGKSTLLSRVSAAKPAIASYPFTTLHPVLGVVRVPGGAGEFVACDVPGLIEGAHQGRGLGHQFLRHIERTRVLIHVVDAAGVDGGDPVDDMQMLLGELRRHDPALVKRPRVIVANKMDLPEAKANLKQLRAKCRGRRVYPVSCATGEGVDAVVMAVWKQVAKLGPRTGAKAAR